jgi:hypothetical protein
MTKSLVSKVLFSLIASICLVCIPGPAFAQRGGGGGFHGGGGLRGGGGSLGGGLSGGYRGMPGPRAGGAYVRPGASGGYRPYTYPGFRGMRPGPWNGTGRAMVPRGPSHSPNSDGRWSTFARGSNGVVSAAPRSGIRSEPSGPAWQSFGANRAPAVGSGPARGGATAPNALQVRNSISQGRGLSEIHRAFGNSGLVNLRFGLNTSVSSGSALGRSFQARPAMIAPGRGAGFRNVFSPGFGFNRFGFSEFDRFRNFDRFRFHAPFAGFPFRDFDDFFFFRKPFFFNNFFFRRPFFGCFGCGFGFNFGFGLPLWWRPGFAGWYGAPGYPEGLPYGYTLPYDYGLTYNSPAFNGPQSDNSSASGTFPRTPQSEQNSSALVLYLKDGTMYSVRDSWLADGKLHYIATDRSEGVTDLDEIDIQRTVDENARRGVPFTLKPNPTSSQPPR